MVLGRGKTLKKNALRHFAHPYENFVGHAKFMSLLKMGKFPISHIMQKFEGSVNLFRNLIFSFRTQCKNIRGLRTHFTHPFPQFAHCAKTERVCAKPNSHAPKPKGLSEFLFKSLLSPISKAPSHCESLYHLATSSLHSVASSLSYSTHHPPPPQVHLTSLSFHFPIRPSHHFHMARTRGALTAPLTTRTARQRASSS